MQHCRVAANELTYSAIISACEKGRQWKFAGGLLSLTSQEDVITLSAVLSAFQKADQWESAFTQLGMMLLGQVQPNTFSLNSVISSCDGSWQQPLSMLATPRFQELNDEISYNSVMMSICEEVLQWTKALELLRCMKQGGLRPDEASFCAANLRDLVTCVVDMYKPRTELMTCELWITKWRWRVLYDIIAEMT